MAGMKKGREALPFGSLLAVEATTDPSTSLRFGPTEQPLTVKSAAPGAN